MTTARHIFGAAVVLAICSGTCGGASPDQALRGDVTSARGAVVGFDELPCSPRTEPLAEASFSFSRQRLFPGFDGKLCKIQPSIATDGKGVAILGFQKLLLSGCDVFYGQFLSKSVDGGMTWSEPVEQAALADTHENGLRVAHYATVRYAFKRAKWYAIGMAQLYEGDKRPFQKYVDGRPYGTPIFVSLDAEKGAFTGYRTLPFPFEYEMALPFGQALECENGDVIMPFYFRPIGAGKKSQCVTVRYAFDGDGMKVVAAGTPVKCDSLARGVGEPSLARLGGKVYMTVRSDEAGMWCVSCDGGLSFSEPCAWTWTDGRRIGNKNTQQHWMPCGGGLFLAYTREDRTNRHVFRNRAPIFAARFDPVCGGLVRDSEVTIVPELGARLGNFCVANDGASGCWLVTAEWMQPRGCERYGSDNSLWLVKTRGGRQAIAAAGTKEKPAVPHVRGSLSDLSRYEVLHPRFAKAFAFMRRPDLAELPCGRYEIDGSNCWAMVQEASLKPFADENKYEVHCAFIDIQSPITGSETIGVTEPEPKVFDGFNVEKDCVLFKAKGEPWTLKPGEFAIFFPEKGAHAPGLSSDGPRTIRKLVVKVRNL